MNKLTYLFLSLAVLVLVGCSTTTVYPGEKEGRSYINQSPHACETLRFFCDSGFQPFTDDTGCGCEPATEPIEPADTPEPIFANEGEACGFVDGQSIRCEESTFCARVEWLDEEPLFQCTPLGVCSDYNCEEGSSCVIMESWPAIVRCATDSADEPAEEPVEEPIDEPVEGVEEELVEDTEEDVTEFSEEEVE